MTVRTNVSGNLAGVRTDVELTFDVPIERMWELVTDVTRTGEWSPECTHSAWLDTGRLPRIGARFEGRNRYPNGDTSRVVCRVTEVVRPRTFAWVVVADETSGRPDSFWRYDLTPAGSGRTVVRQEFVHGPGETGLSLGVRDDPDHAAEILADRLAQLRRNMTRTLTAMAASA